MRKRVLVILGSICLVLLLLSLFVLGSVVRNLLAARDTLEGSLEGLDREEVLEARDHLEAAASDLDGFLVDALGLIPILGTNLDAVEDTTDKALPVVKSALDLQTAVDELDANGFIEDGRIRVEALVGLDGLLTREVARLEELAEVLGPARSGALAPPLWDALEGLRRRVLDLLEDGSAVDRIIELSDDLLGLGSERTYLLLLLNNAELRGGGGIVAGLGSFRVDNGRVELGELYTREELDQEPRLSVPAPPEYEERFGLYAANTTLWYNAAMTPHFPDAALVSARLFEKQTGVETDGVLGVDPRGLAALTPEGAEVEVPGRDYTLSSEELAPWIFSNAYEDFTNQKVRRAAILEVGRNAIETGLREGFGGRGGLESIGEAFAAQHLRFVSFDDEESAALTDAGVSGSLDPQTRDTMLVTVHNFGGGGTFGSKLDYWTERSIRHGCVVDGDGAAECATRVTFNNSVPDGLSRYAAGRPYGLLRNYSEIYVPGSARLEEVELDGEPVEYRPEEQGDLLSVAVYVEIPQGERSSIEVVYTLPPEDDSYSLSMIPQPLASDAEVSLRLRVPKDWTIVGAGYDNEVGEVEWETILDRTVEVQAGPDGRTGLPALWEGIRDFWHQPLF
ncbi:MAG: DUF4012 domain-containing protein [Actinomycetota bacterium]